MFKFKPDRWSSRSGSAGVDSCRNLDFRSVSSEISDFKPRAQLRVHRQSNILHIKYAEKTDDYGLGFSI